MISYIRRQIKQIQQEGWISLFVKISKIAPYLLAILIIIIIRLIRPVLLVRTGMLTSSRIGHFATNTEMYLCERDAGINLPNQRYIDIFFIDGLICNQQLATMWQRALHIWPAFFMSPVERINGLIPGGEFHKIPNPTQYDRDVYNLLDIYSSHLQFTSDEISRGEKYLRSMGIPNGARFICLNVRDSAYLEGAKWAYHNYRDSSIQNYILAAEALAEKGYFVIRMGAKVKASLESNHPRIIDYATNGMRNDFMDIYLGASCTFCLSTGTGWDNIPEIFRRPVVYVNFVPLGYLHTFSFQFLSITKRHINKQTGQELTLKEIFSNGVGYFLSQVDYESNNIDLIENTSEEIRDVAIEMADRINGTWRVMSSDDDLQKIFWGIFPCDVLDANNRRPLHGQIYSRFGADFLRKNLQFLK